MGIFSSRKAQQGGTALTATWPYGQCPGWMVDGMQVSFFTGRESLEVVGESFHQDELWTLADLLVGANPGDDVNVEVPALLVCEQGNPYDPNAVAVWIGGLQVGHVARHLAPDLRAAVIGHQEANGQPVGVAARIIGGGPGRDNLGVFVTVDPTDFGMVSTRLPGNVRSGHGEVVWDIRRRGAAWEALRNGADSPAELAALTSLLETERDPLFRHYAFQSVESALYAARDVSPEYLDRYDTTCEAHYAELPFTRPLLVEELGVVPIVEMFRQAAIRWEKAHDNARSLSWAERGIAFYGDDPARGEEVFDLEKRAARCRKRMEPKPSKAASTRSSSGVETLTCQTCGTDFERPVSRGRKPHECPTCRQGPAAADTAVGTASDSGAATAEAAGPPAGWFDDPHGGSVWRWWDGTAWTDHTAPK